MREAIKIREKSPPGSGYLCAFHFKNWCHNVPMIIKQPVRVSFESQRICSLGRMKQFVIRREVGTIGPHLMHETWETPGPWDHLVHPEVLLLENLLEECKRFSFPSPALRFDSGDSAGSLDRCRLHCDVTNEGDLLVNLGQGFPTGGTFCASTPTPRTLGNPDGRFCLSHKWGYPGLVGGSLGCW